MIRRSLTYLLDLLYPGKEPLQLDPLWVWFLFFGLLAILIAALVLG